MIGSYSAVVRRVPTPMQGMQALLSRVFARLMIPLGGNASSFMAGGLSRMGRTRLVWDISCTRSTSLSSSLVDAKCVGVYACLDRGPSHCNISIVPASSEGSCKAWRCDVRFLSVACASWGRAAARVLPCAPEERLRSRPRRRPHAAHSATSLRHRKKKRGPSTAHSNSLRVCCRGL